MTSIPLVDLAAAHAEVAEEVETGFKRIIAETAFIGGAEVAAFEQEYAAFSGLPHCVGVANGTDALELALRAVGVGPGTEVILPANTFIATAEAVARAGAAWCWSTATRVPISSTSRPRSPRSRRPPGRSRRCTSTASWRRSSSCAPGLAGRDVAIVEDAAQCQGAPASARARRRRRWHRRHQLLPGQEPRRLRRRRRGRHRVEELATTGTHAWAATAA
jgi:hypothetical protein